MEHHPRVCQHSMFLLKESSNSRGIISDNLGKDGKKTHISNSFLLKTINKGVGLH